MNNADNKDQPGGLSDKDLNELLGPKGLNDVTEAIQHPERVSDVPNPVKINHYYDLKLKKMRVELDSRGIGIKESLEEIRGIEKINDQEFEKVMKGTWVGTGYVSENEQSNLGVHVIAISTNKMLFLKTELMPNEHSITAKGPKYYRVDINALPPAYKDPHPRVPNILGINFDMLQPEAVVGLLND